MVNAYIIRRKALGPCFHIPNGLESYDQIFMKDAIIRNGYKIYAVDENETHYDHPGNKSFRMRAAQRAYFGFHLKGFFYKFIFRKVLLSPVKTVLPALAYNESNIIFGNSKYWLAFLKGYLRPEKHLRMKR